MEVKPKFNNPQQQSSSSSDSDSNSDNAFVLSTPNNTNQSCNGPHHPFVRRSSALLPLAAMPIPRQQVPARSTVSYSSDSPMSNVQVIAVYAQPPESPSETPYVRAEAPFASRRNGIVDSALSSGITRQLAALYIHVDLTTVERVRWLALFTIILYLLTSWFCHYYIVAGLGTFTGLLGIAACSRPHCSRLLPWIKTFIVLNYVVMALLVWVFIRTLAIDLPHSSSSSSLKERNNDQANEILVILIVPIAWLLHWRTQRLARMYRREFGMIEALAYHDRQDGLPWFRSPLSSTSSMSSLSPSSSSSSPRLF